MVRVGHRHRGRSAAGPVAVCHLDLYRLDPLVEEEAGLLEDYLGPEAISFVEWPERLRGTLAEATVVVRLSHIGGDRRRIEVRR